MLLYFTKYDEIRYNSYEFRSLFWIQYGEYVVTYVWTNLLTLKSLGHYLIICLHALSKFNAYNNHPSILKYFSLSYF